MTFMRKFMDMLNMENWKDDSSHNDKIPQNAQESFRQKTTISKNNKKYGIPPTPTLEQRLQLEEDFPYVPFIKHCATNYHPDYENHTFPNINEQHQILYYIDSFNKSLSNIGRELDVNDLHIYTECVKFGYYNGMISFPKTYIDFSPYTKTGKKAKFPVSIIFTTEDDFDFTAPTHDFETGRINFMKDGNIGKARITLFRNHSSCNVHYKMFGVNLIIDKVTRASRIGDEKIEIYRNEASF